MGTAFRPHRGGSLPSVLFAAALGSGRRPHHQLRHAKATKPAAPSSSEVQVDLLRGLADIFSRGMDTLAGKLNHLGYSAQVYSTHGWQSVAQRIASKYSRGHKDIVVVIGHSLGANATLTLPERSTGRTFPSS